VVFNKQPWNQIISRPFIQMTHDSILDFSLRLQEKDKSRIQIESGSIKNDRKIIMANEKIDLIIKL
jgi:hypothetical protein